MSKHFMQKASHLWALSESAEAWPQYFGEPAPADAEAEIARWDRMASRDLCHQHPRARRRRAAFTGLPEVLS